MSCLRQLFACPSFLLGLTASMPRIRGSLPEEALAKHLESIGSPEALAAVKSRTAYGITRVRSPIKLVPLMLPEPGK